MNGIVVLVVIVHSMSFLLLVLVPLSLFPMGLWVISLSPYGYNSNRQAGK